MIGHLCDCGSNLRLVELKTYEQVTQIRKDGKLSNRKRKPHLSYIQLTDHNGESSFLQCWECDNKYEFMGLDNNGKVCRGDKF